MLSNFLQSKEWEEFQNRIGRQTFRVDSCLFIRMNLPLNQSYLYSPRINLGATQQNILQQILDEIKNYQINTDLFVRVELDRYQGSRQSKTKQSNVRCLPRAKSRGRVFTSSEVERSDAYLERSREVRCFPCPTTQPRTSLILDLTKSEDELLSQMKEKTRYNIRLAEKRGIKYQVSSIKYFEEFWELMEQTSQRNKFSSHSKKYYQTMIEFLGEKKMVYLLCAKHENDLLAAMVLFIYHNQAIYLHGASSNLKRNLMAPYLLHWNAIKFARSKGCKTYDFWGVSNKASNIKRQPSDFSDGVTRFKLGFGGEIVNYPGSFEMPLKKMAYDMYRAIRWVNRQIKPRNFN